MKRLLQLRGFTGIILAAVLLVLFITTLILAVRVTTLSGRVERLAAGVGGEIEAQHRLGTVLESNQRTVTTHLSEVRRLLNLSPGNYTFGGDDAAKSAADQRAADPAQLFFNAVQRIRTERDVRALETMLDPLVPAALERFLSEATLRIRSAGRLRWRLEDESGVAHHELYATPAEFLIRSLPGGQQRIAVEGEAYAEALAAVQEQLRREQQAVRAALADHRQNIAALQAALGNQRLRERLAQLQLSAQAVDEGPLRQVTRVVSIPSSQELFRIELHGSPPRILVDATLVADRTTLLDALLSRVEQADPRAVAQQEINAAMRTVRALGDDARFRDRLALLGLRLRLDPRETLDFFVFDLETTAEQRRFGGFGVQKGVGRIFVLDAEDIVISTLETAGADPFADIRGTHEQPGGISAPSDRSLPTDFPVGFRPSADGVAGTNLILVGTHEGKADAIMLLHLSPQRTISLISIPRDIWWRNRKLADIAQIYGVEGLAPEIAAIIGQRVDGWVAVDMYAFIEVVDLLGGIELTLAEPLVDPSYRVREGERWSTLAYPAGTHHLSGIEALRIARSRHTTTDFGRSERQQLILEALRVRVNQLHAGNLDRYYRLFETLNRYVTSSYSMWELAQFFLAYRSAPIAQRTGLTFDNVLYNTYSNIHIRGLSIEEVDDDFFLGGWILLPRGEDWGVVRWFVEQNLAR